jgi:hypothetical protein
MKPADHADNVCPQITQAAKETIRLICVICGPSVKPA